MADRRGLRAVGADRAVDQVVRWNEFEKQHPGVKIRPPQELGGRNWVLTWEQDGKPVTVSRWELRDILDEAEKRFPVAPD